jgi:nuclear pore complex protein Nup155
VVPNSLKFGAVDAIVEVVVDEERHILYTRTQESKLQMFDLGKSGEGAPKKVAEESRVGEQRDSRGRGGGNRAAARATKANIVSIAPISGVESKWLHLVAVTSDGRRIYLSTSTSTGSSMTGVNGSSGAGGQKPSVLRVVMTRPAPSVGAVGGMGAFGSSPLGVRAQSEGGFVIKAEAAHCSSGVLVLSDASPPTQSRLVVATRDLTGPASTSAGNASIGGQGSASRSMRSLRETVTMLGVEGRALAIADVLPPPEQAAAVEFSVCEPGSAAAIGQVYGDETVRARRLWARGELATQHVLPRRRSIVLSTMGLMELAFNRPVDLLQRLLESNSLRSVLEDFFQRFGASEAAAMCLLLAARLTSDEDNIVPGAIADRAAEAFEDPRLVGVPQMQGGGAATSGLSSGGGFNMGQVVQEAEPVFSGAHDGLCLAAARLLRCVWELPVMDVRKDAGAESNGDGGIISCRLVVLARCAVVCGDAWWESRVRLGRRLQIRWIAWACWSREWWECVLRGPFAVSLEQSTQEQGCMVHGVRWLCLCGDVFG